MPDEKEKHDPVPEPQEESAPVTVEDASTDGSGGSDDSPPPDAPPDPGA
jgi:hypothetical protein